MTDVQFHSDFAAELRDADEQSLLSHVYAALNNRMDEEPWISFSSRLSELPSRLSAVFENEKEFRQSQYQHAVAAVLRGAKGGTEPSEDEWGLYVWIAKFGLQWKENGLTWTDAAREVFRKDLPHRAPMPRLPPAPNAADRKDFILWRQELDRDQLVLSVDHFDGDVNRFAQLYLSRLTYLFDNEIFKAVERPICDSTPNGWRIVLGTFVSRELLHRARPTLSSLSLRNLSQKTLIDLEVFKLLQITSRKELTELKRLLHADLVKAKVQPNLEHWTSQLSLDQSLSIVEQRRSEIPTELYPAIATLVSHAVKTSAATVISHEDDPLNQIKALAKSDSKTLQSSVDEINRLLGELSKKKFRTAAELKETVNSIQEVVRRGEFKLVATKPIKVKDKEKGLVVRIRTGDTVALAADEANEQYTNGRVGIAKDGNWAQPVRRVGLVPLAVKPPRFSE